MRAAVCCESSPAKQSSAFTLRIHLHPTAFAAHDQFDTPTIIQEIPCDRQRAFNKVNAGFEHDSHRTVGSMGRRICTVCALEPTKPKNGLNIGSENAIACLYRKGKESKRVWLQRRYRIFVWMVGETPLASAIQRSSMPMITSATKDRCDPSQEIMGLSPRFKCQQRRQG